MRNGQRVSDGERPQILTGGHDRDRIGLVPLVTIFETGGPDVFVGDEPSDRRLWRDLHRLELARRCAGRLQIGNVVQVVWLVGIDLRISDERHLTVADLRSDNRPPI